MLGALNPEEATQSNFQVLVGLYMRFILPVNAPLLNLIWSVTNTGSVSLNDISPKT